MLTGIGKVNGGGLEPWKDWISAPSLPTSPPYLGDHLCHSAKAKASKKLGRAPVLTTKGDQSVGTRNGSSPPPHPTPLAFCLRKHNNGAHIL